MTAPARLADAIEPLSFAAEYRRLFESAVATEITRHLTTTEREAIDGIDPAVLLAIGKIHSEFIAPIESRLALSVQESIRNEAIAALARDFTMTPADIEVALVRYYGTAWRQDRHAKACPESHLGTQAQLLWLALKARPYPVKKRQILNIINNMTAQSARRPHCAPKP